MSVNRNPFNRAFSILLSFYGVWPDERYSLFFRIIYSFAVFVVQYCHVLHYWVHRDTETILGIIDNMATIMAHFKGHLKLAVFWYNEQKFREILTIMKEDYSNDDDDINVRETTKKAAMSRRIEYAIIFLHTMSISGLGIGILVAIFNNNIGVGQNTTDLLFITKLEFPFEITKQSTYFCVLTTEYIILLTFGWATGIMNALLLVLVLHAVSQIDVACHWLIHLTTSNESKEKSVAVQTGKIIEKHKKIMHIADNIEYLYTHIGLVLFVSNTLMICFIAYLVVTAVGTPGAAKKIMRYMFFYIVTNLEAFIFCFAGEYLRNKSKEIGLAAYSSAWYNMEPKDSRGLLFIILRSQKPLTLTAGNMMDLSLETFTRIMNISGSFLSLLMAMR